MPVSDRNACAVSLGKEVSHNKIISEYIGHKKQIEIDQQTNKAFDKFFGNSIQDYLVDKNELNLYVIFKTNALMERKMIFLC